MANLDINKLMQQAQQMQQQMAEAQEQLATETVEASAGGGLVTVRATGNGEIIAIKIDPKAIDPDDPELLEDMVLAAVNEALRSAQSLAQSRLGAMTGGLGCPACDGDPAARRVAGDGPTQPRGLHGARADAKPRRGRRHFRARLPRRLLRRRRSHEAAHARDRPGALLRSRARVHLDRRRRTAARGDARRRGRRCGRPAHARRHGVGRRSATSPSARPGRPTGARRFRTSGSSTCGSTCTMGPCSARPWTTSSRS